MGIVFFCKPLHVSNIWSSRILIMGLRQWSRTIVFVQVDEINRTKTTPKPHFQVGMSWDWLHEPINFLLLWSIFKSLFLYSLLSSGICSCKLIFIISFIRPSMEFIFGLFWFSLKFLKSLVHLLVDIVHAQTNLAGLPSSYFYCLQLQPSS